MVHYQARSTDIEQTAYILLAMLEEEGKAVLSGVIPIVRWLSKQRMDSVDMVLYSGDELIFIRIMFSFVDNH